MAVSGDQSARDIATPLFQNKSGHEQDVTCLTWFTDDRLVTGSKDKTVRIWTLTEGTQVGASMVHEFQVRRVGITGDGRIISCCVDEQMVAQVWNADTQELESGPWSCGSSENYGIVHRNTLSQAPHDKLFATWYEKYVVIWEMAGIMRIRGEFSYESIGGYRDPHATCFSPDGKRLAAFYEGGHTLIVLDVASDQVIFEPLKREPQSQINHMLWSPDGARLLCCVNDGRDDSTCWIDSSTGETIEKSIP